MKQIATRLLEGKVAVITGGATGIGLAMAKKLVTEGAHVFIFGRRKAELDAAVAAIGGNVTAVQGDVPFLASDQASYVNGADFQVDGGLAQV